MNTTMDKSQTPPLPRKERFPLALLCLTLGAFAIGMTLMILMCIFIFGNAVSVTAIDVSTTHLHRWG
ncbi:hypothetical protein [Paenibacillus jilunlii]|uniref:Uncharacterized protein n=1 Tax=Paenibacillus jilunlii TaxID=682956 RepID=A0ABR5SXS3_9BACL|nr:hypothetical protein [Paenibacillus jilunlii]KWX77564.1 hypothetical protein AML91_07160 [Paenibacillus jilunlii]